jgi:cyclopropane fatty-acyl-phospholipid synthase-like methyltransferase
MIEGGMKLRMGDLEFDDEFMRENMMGPNSMRIVEEMTRDINLSTGMRVLDLGCGRGLTSIFLAMKFGVTVYATDLWIPATENFSRIREKGLEDLIIPIHADANELPFADEFFDMIISVDSYHYFGYETEYLDKNLAPLLKKGGRISVGVPGLQKEFNGNIPVEMEPFYKEEYHFHTCSWWKDLWSGSEFVENIQCKELDCHKEAWDEWLMCDNEHAKQDIDMMKAEGGKYFSTVSFSATRK